MFDGHGGWQLSEYCMKYMHSYIEEELKKASATEEDIKAAITLSFERIEREWLNIAHTSFSAGFPKTGYVGSCALIAIMVGNKLYVANAGDSKAAVYRQADDGTL